LAAPVVTAARDQYRSNRWRLGAANGVNRAQKKTLGVFPSLPLQACGAGNCLQLW
jgi:hypothetical protein